MMFTFKKSALVGVSLLLAFSLIFLVGGTLTFAEENDFEELNTLRYSVEGTYEGEPTEYLHRLVNIGTEEELFRLDVTIYETGATMSVIMDKANETVFVKQMGTERWQEIPMLFSRMWTQYREGAIGSYGSADDWRRWAEDEQEEYLLEGEEDGEENTVRVYDIGVNEPIEDSVFSPDDS